MTRLHRWTDGVLPSWEGVLKLETRAKFHFGWFIWWRWYFCLIPLSKRCKIDLNIILFGWAEVGFWIYFLHMQFVKVGQNCNVGSQAPKDVSHTLSDGYKKERHKPHLIINSSHTFLSHLIGSYNLRGLSLSFARVKDKLKISDCFRAFLDNVDQRWLERVAKSCSTTERGALLNE